MALELSTTLSNGSSNIGTPTSETTTSFTFQNRSKSKIYRISPELNSSLLTKFFFENKKIKLVTKKNYFEIY